MLDKGTAISAAQQYAKAVVEEFSPSAIVIFGSYVNGCPHKDSDIDVGVIFNGFKGDWRQTAARLWRLRRGISFDIEPHFLDSSNDNSGFVKHILMTGHIIYENSADENGVAVAV